MSTWIPQFLQLCVVIREMDLDAILDEIPHLLLACLSYIKLKNIFLNKKRIKILLNFILNDWKILRDELPVLDRITEQGSRLAHMYRVTLMWATIGFIYIPLINPTLDLIIPLNETRPKEQLFGVCYVFINPDDYFTAVFLHMGWTTWVTVYNIITVDSLYILIIHHVCGLFDVCGYQIETIFKRSNLQHYQFKQCVIHHHKALEFFNYLQECSQNMNLMLVAITMILISTTAVQILMHMDQPLDSARFILFFVCSHIHLYIVSLFGQIILNHSKTLAERIYSCNWYGIPIKFQKLLCIMILRCSKPAILSAGGLYDMNMENYGKVCIGYVRKFVTHLHALMDFFLTKGSKSVHVIFYDVSVNEGVSVNLTISTNDDETVVTDKTIKNGNEKRSAYSVYKGDCISSKKILKHTMKH